MSIVPDSPVRIAWVSCVGEKGGAEVVMVNTLRGLNRELFQPAVFLLRPGPLAAELQAMAVTVYQLKAHRMRNLFAVASSVPGHRADGAQRADRPPPQ